MSRVFGREALEPVATFWRVHRRDGVTLGFTSHDRDLWFGGVLHRAAPGMVPSAIRRSAPGVRGASRLRMSMTRSKPIENPVAGTALPRSRPIMPS